MRPLRSVLIIGESLRACEWREKATENSMTAVGLCLLVATGVHLALSISHGKPPSAHHKPKRGPDRLYATVSKTRKVRKPRFRAV